MSATTDNAAALEELTGTKGISNVTVKGNSYFNFAIGKDTFETTPAAARIFAAVPAKERLALIKAADVVRAEAGHPLDADRPTTKAIWDHHIAAAAGSELTPEAVAAYRKSVGVRRPSKA